MPNLRGLSAPWQEGLSMTGKRAPPEPFSMSQVGRLIMDWSARYQDLCRAEHDYDLEDADILAARLLVRESRLALLKEVKALHAENRRLEAENRRLSVERSRLNVENRRLADIAIAARQNVKMEGTVR